jgi:alkylated DNA repair dioxygenase AlkB
VTDVEPLPDGLVYQPDFVAVEEERHLLEWLGCVDFREIVMHGQAAKRTARHYGVGYSYDARALTEEDPLPAELEELRARCAELAVLEPDALVEALVQRYPAGATMGWHRDAPMFGIVVGVSLGSASRMRFQRGKGEERRVAQLVLEPRSAYVLKGSSRWQWQHSIPPTKAERYSITFRTLKG